MKLFGSGYIELIVKDKKGKIIHYSKHKMKSFVDNIGEILFALLCHSFGSYPATTTVIGSDALTHDFPYQSGDVSVIAGLLAPANDDTYGVLIGAGIKSVEPSDYWLDNQIKNGAGLGQMVYGETTYNKRGDIGGKYVLEVSRIFINMTTQDITVWETGLAIKTYDANYNEISVLIERSVLSSPVTVPSGASLTVKYTLSIPVASV